MTERRNREEEFYEAMPGTMQGTRVRREREVDDSDRDMRISPLAWMGLAAVILLGLLLLGAMNANRSQQTSPGPSSNGAGAQTQNLGAQPGGAGNPGAKNMP